MATASHMSYISPPPVGVQIVEVLVDTESGQVTVQRLLMMKESLTDTQDEDAFAGTLLSFLSRIPLSNPLLKAKTTEGKIYGHIGVQVS